MSARRSSFDKLQRDRNKKAKAAAKRERRHDRSAEGDGPSLDDGAAQAETDNVSTADLLQMIDLVHQQFEAGTIDLEEYEDRKADLLGRISVD